MLRMFWTNHDSTACHSRQYMSAIFYHNEEQKRLAEETKEEHQKTLTKPIVTRIAEASTFYEAENYHQKYLLRQNREILRALKLSDKQLITSTVATRLNGYCGGYGNLSDLEKEIDTFGLDEPTQQELRRLVSRGTHH